MKRSLIPHLLCLHCGADLSLSDVRQSVSGAAEEEIIEGDLNCLSCHKRYGIERGVPRFVEASMSKPDDLNTGARFHDSWKEFSRMDPRYWQQFFDWINPVNPRYLVDKVVLEAGCGKGRHTEVVRRAGASMVAAVDIGDTVDIAFQTVGTLPGVHIIQADIANLPLKSVFDYAFSVGVLHHMAEPYSGFASIVSKVKKTGAVSCWVYGRENNDWIINFINPIRLGMTAHMPAALLKVLSAALAAPLFLYCRFLSGPWRTLQQHAPFVPNVFYQDYLAYLGKFDFTEVFNIVFDHLVAPVAHYLTCDELRQWCSRTGLRNPIIRWHNKNSWTLFAALNNQIPSELVDETKQPSSKHQESPSLSGLPQ